MADAAHNDETTTDVFYGLLDVTTGLPVRLGCRRIDSEEYGETDAPELTTDLGYPFYRAPDAESVALTLERKPFWLNDSERFPGHGAFAYRLTDLQPAKFTILTRIYRDNDGKLTGFEKTTRAEITPALLPKLIRTNGSLTSLNAAQARKLQLEGATYVLVTPTNEREQFESMIGSLIRIGLPGDLNCYPLISVVEHPASVVVALGERQDVCPDPYRAPDTSGPKP